MLAQPTHKCALLLVCPYLFQPASEPHRLALVHHGRTGAGCLGAIQVASRSSQASLSQLDAGSRPARRHVGPPTPHLPPVTHLPSSAVSDPPSVVHFPSSTIRHSLCRGETEEGG